jgi:hypothetical protein
MGYLRAERHAWQVLRHSALEAVSAEVATVSEWQWMGIGWSTRGDAWLAGLEQRAMAQARADARDVLCIEKARGAEDQSLSLSNEDWQRGERRVHT